MGRRGNMTRVGAEVENQANAGGREGRREMKEMEGSDGGNHAGRREFS